MEIRLDKGKILKSKDKYVKQSNPAEIANAIRSVINEISKIKKEIKNLKIKDEYNAWK